MSQVKQFFFDCDNTLVFSEQLAFEACADLTNALLFKYGVTDRYTSEQLITEFIGQNFRGIMAALQEKYNFEISTDRIEYFVQQEENAVIAKIQNRARSCEGSMQVLEKLYDEKKYSLAVVSSSALRRIRASLKKSKQDKFIPHEHMYSAATSLEEPKFKPDPAIYYYAMDRLGVKPEECIAVEDSKSGATAAIRAGIPCIAYVGAYSVKEKQDQVAHTLTALGCKAVMRHWNEFFDCVEKLEQS